MTPAGAGQGERELVVMRIAGQLFGVEVGEVREVFPARATSPVPLTGPEVTGLLNLRGRIVTAVCARRRLGLPPRPAEAPAPMVVGVDRNGESYGLLVDSVEEVVKLPRTALEPVPANMDRQWAGVSEGVCRFGEELLVVVAMPRLLGLAKPSAAA